MNTIVEKKIFTGEDPLEDMISHYNNVDFVERKYDWRDILSELITEDKIKWIIAIRHHSDSPDDQELEFLVCVDPIKKYIFNNYYISPYSHFCNINQEYPGQDVLDIFSDPRDFIVKNVNDLFIKEWNELEPNVVLAASL